MLRVWSAAELRWAKATFDALYPPLPEEGMDVGIVDMDLDGYLRRTIAQVPLEPALSIRLAIWMVALAPIFVLRRPCTLMSIVPTERERVLHALLASPIYVIRQLIILLRAVGGLLYGASPTIRARVLGKPAARITRVPVRRGGTGGHRPAA